MERTLPVLVTVFCLASAAGAQEFETVTVKPLGIQPCPGLDGEFHQDESGISYRNVRLADVIEKADGVAVEPAEGPVSIWARRYDIDAKTPRGAEFGQMPAMLRKMLSDRFHAAVHESSGEREELSLKVSKGGLKMRPHVSGRGGKQDCGAIAMPKAGVGVHLDARGFSMKQVALSLSYRLGQSVLDKTGKDGRYDFTVEYYPPRPSLPMIGEMGPSVGLGYPERAQLTPLDRYPAIPDALEDQLGLKLEPHVTSRTALIVDRADPEPSKK